jgi:hypothetical protein
MNNFRPMNYHESYWDYITSSNRDICKLIKSYIEQWINIYNNNKSATKEKKKDLLNRLKSKKRDQFIAAFFELYIFMLFTNLGFDVEIEPVLDDNSKPDFLVTNIETKDQIYIEVTSISEGEINSKRETSINCIKDKINKQIASDKYTISLYWYGICVENDINKMVVNEIKNWIAKPTSCYEKQFDNWYLKLEAKEVTKPCKRIIAMRMNEKVQCLSQKSKLTLDNPVEYSMNASELIKKGLTGKTKYDDLKQSYIIAINTLGHFFDTINLEEALFGTECIVHEESLNGFEERFCRQKDGFFSTKKSDNVSAILCFFNLKPFSLVDLSETSSSKKKNPKIYINSSAIYPINSKFIAKLKNHNSNSSDLDLNKLYDVIGINKEDWIKSCNSS